MSDVSGGNRYPQRDVTWITVESDTLVSDLAGTQVRAEAANVAAVLQKLAELFEENHQEGK